ncbi:MFS transporter [Streptomyces gobiensis]|uniref:MFS transporter n=1 Tax=Streptomyces gobiensis TaxID=2875706 RepID=UPI001E34EDC2|nr:MFS transporter [Streptomyces gobiensis]UGY94189.1 MFS transporter [Streptomyces gobiensis]
MELSSPAQTVRKAGAREWLGLAVLALPTILLSLDVTVLYLAMPHFSADLNPSSNQILWIIDIYGFLIAGFLITMGSLGDRVGRRRLLMIGAVGFTAASVLAAYSTSAEMLIAARALMGVSGASLMPSTLSLISNMFLEAKQRATAIAIWAACFSSGIAIGPVVGGLLLEWFWWGSVFLLAVPVMVILLVTAPFLLPEFRGTESQHRIDLVSVVLSLGAVIPVIWGVKELAEDGMAGAPVVAIVAGLLLGLLFVLRQRNLAEPLLDLGLFANRAFSAALTVLLIGVGVVGGVYLLVSQYLQLIEALSPLKAGLWMLPSAGAMIVTAGVAPELIRWIRPGYLLGTGLVVSAVGYFILSQVEPSDSMPTLVTGMVVMFAGLGPVFALGTDLVVGAAPAEKSGSAAAMSETSMEFGISLGIAILGSIGAAVFRNDMKGGVPDGIPAEAAHVAGDTLPGAVEVAKQLPPEQAGNLTGSAFDAFTNGLAATALVCGATVLFLALMSFLLLRGVRTAAQIESAAQAEAAGTADEAELAAR